jgi:hypothetical protein
MVDHLDLFVPPEDSGDGADKCAYNEVEGGCDEIQERTLFAIVSIGAAGGDSLGRWTNRAGGTRAAGDWADCCAVGCESAGDLLRRDDDQFYLGEDGELIPVDEAERDQFEPTPGSSDH